MSVNFETDLISSIAQSTILQSQNTSATAGYNTSSDYAKILAEKIAEVESQFEEAQENLSEQNQSSGGSEKNSATETIKRFMPDGSILITTYDGSSVVQQVKLRPHMVPVADYSAPPTATGAPEFKLVPKQNLDLLSLLM